MLRPDKLSYPFLHFPGCLIGKSQRQDIGGRDILVEQVSDPVCQDPCFPGTCSCNDKAWTVDCQDGFLLRFVQIFDEIFPHIFPVAAKINDFFFSEIIYLCHFKSCINNKKLPKPVIKGISLSNPFMRSIEVFISRVFIICFLAVNFGLSNAQISSPTANFSDTLDYPVYTAEDPYFIFHTSTPGIPVQGSLLATPPYGTPGFDFSWSMYNSSINAFDPPFHSESGVATSRVDNLDPGCYQVHITAIDLDTLLRAWVFSNDSYVAVEKDENGKIKPYKYTCDYLWLNGVAEAEIHTYYDLANGNPVNLPNGMTYEWTSDDAEYEILGADRFLNLIIYNSPPYSRPPTKDTRFTLTAVDSFGLSRADEVLYESVHVKAEFTTFIEDEESPGSWIEEENPSGEAPLEVRFINLSENGVEFQWTLVDSAKTGEDDSEVITEALEDSVVYTYYIPDHYFPTMTAFSEAGCVDSFPLGTRVDIIVEPSALDAPNVFTPNGDGVNDFFLVQAKSLKSFRIHIFSRSGRKVYEFEQNEEKFEWEGWDGTIDGKGEKFAQPGVYYYVIEAVGWDAERYRGHPPYKGFVYLYRELE